MVPRTWTPDAAGATSILNELDDADWVDTTTLDTLLVQDAPDVPRTSLPANSVSKAELGTTEVTELERARDAVVTFSSVATDDPARSGARVSPAWSLRSPSRTAPTPASGTCTSGRHCARRASSRRSP